MENVKSTTLAFIYELYGLKDDALKIYREILLENPNDKESQAAIKRLMLAQKHFPPTNQAQKKLFTQPQSPQDLIQFQRWLLQWK